MTTYVTFGHCHQHYVNGVSLDHNTVAVFESANKREGRRKAFALFGQKFSFEYFNEEFDHKSLRFYRMGLKKI